MAGLLDPPDVLSGVTAPAKPDAKLQKDPAEDAAAKTRAIVDARVPNQEQTQKQGGSPGSWQGVSIPQFQKMEPPPAPETTSPVQAWGSLAMVMAGIGGLMTRTHATTALNAAAEAMKGFHQGDLERNKELLDRWRVANQNTIDAMNYQKTIYEALLRTRHEDEIERYHDIQAQAQATRDNILLQRLEQGGVSAAESHMKDFNRAADNYMKETDNVDKTQEVGEKLAALRQTDEYNALDWKQKAAAELKLLHEVAPQEDKRGKGSTKDIELAKKFFPPPPGGDTVQWTKDFEVWYKTAWPLYGRNFVPGNPGKHKIGDKEVHKDRGVVMFNGGDYMNELNWVPVEKKTEKPAASTNDEFTKGLDAPQMQ